MRETRAKRFALSPRRYRARYVRHDTTRRACNSSATVRRDFLFRPDSESELCRTARTRDSPLTMRESSNDNGCRPATQRHPSLLAAAIPSARTDTQYRALITAGIITEINLITADIIIAVSLLCRRGEARVSWPALITRSADDGGRSRADRAGPDRFACVRRLANN